MKVSVNYWLFWIPFIQLLTCISTQLASNICLDDQRSLLLQLRNSLNYTISEPNRLTTWNETPDCCQWKGVQCNSSSGHVIGLDLCGESISGTSDDFRALFRLGFLKSLNLANNSFNSRLFPTGFGQLTGLTYLNLSKAGFSGQIPIEISGLVNLVTLDLSSGSYWFGLSPLKLENPNLGGIIRNFSNLRGLYLSGVVISESGSEWCKALSNSVPNLQFLSLSSCNLSGGIDQSLAKLQFLSEIRLDQNNLANVVPDFIANFRNLTSLTLSSCLLNGTFPPKILQLPTLISLDLSYNSFLHGTLPEFPAGAPLQRLVLSFTNFSGRLPESVGHLSELQSIELQNCSFSGLIPSSFSNINQLEYVDLSFNNFLGPIPSFSSAKNLICLHLSNNKLSGTLASTKWSNLSNLTDVDVSANHLQGSIPMEIFSLPSLQMMQLSENRFNGTLGELPNMQSSILNTLDLSKNHLQGSLPTSLFGMKALKILKLSSNNFRGTLNLNLIRQLKNLSSLDLSFNSLSIEANATMAKVSSFPQLSTLKLASCNLRVLPDFLKNQSILQYLDLSINSIRGVMPKWIWGVGNGSLSYLNLSCNSFTGLEQPSSDISTINILDIHGNKIQGETPNLISPRMIYLDYSNNYFTSVSRNIGNVIPYVAYVSLSGNNISHDIPISLCNLTNLQVLDLSVNSLTGKIPQCVLRMTSTLDVLNLKENDLNGTLFNEFPKGCSLSTLSIGDNSLQGQIPRSLANCKQLEVLDIRENGFSGTFPDSLRNLSRLRVLVLRDNNFYGSISCPDNNITWPLLQIMDLSFNNFYGELKAQCFSIFKALMTVEPNSATSQLRVPVLPLNDVYYQDMVEVTSKGEQITLQKILTLYKGIDISSNNFHGAIPTAIGNLITLVFLNMSNNALTGPIPPSIGNLKMLEALDLSNNSLSGMIPTQIANLNFLSLLNLSYNQLTGEIPIGNQLQTFDSTTYIGNPTLCGPPLKLKCSSSSEPSETVSMQARKMSSESGLDWQLILIGAGFGTGVALVTSPLMFWKKGRKWHDKQVDKLVSVICSVCGSDQATLDDDIDQGIGHQLFAFTNSSFEGNMEGVENGTQFCLFCSKLDNSRRRVIHNSSCTCHKLRVIASAALSTCFSE
ncbi:receptor-like protein 7 [Silene latifolia]|uniref:receptor-like protein 7 n=1 Tax=Silene latifolia TaxID=37657 RepID=UPI003D7842FC